MCSFGVMPQLPALDPHTDTVGPRPTRHAAHRERCQQDDSISDSFDNVHAATSAARALMRPKARGGRCQAPTPGPQQLLGSHFRRVAAVSYIAAAAGGCHTCDHTYAHATGVALGGGVVFMVAEPQRVCLVQTARPRRHYGMD